MKTLGKRLVDAIATRDSAALAACFTDDAQLRALIPSGLRERAGAAAAASLISAWFADSTEMHLAGWSAEDVEDRLHVWYRFAGIEEGQPYLAEQHLFCIVTDERIARADLLCSGFRPRGARAAAQPVPAANPLQNDRDPSR
jgi:ketosteroid isomerase-like protein